MLFFCVKMTTEQCRLCGLQKPNSQQIFLESFKGLPVNEFKSFLPELISKYLYLTVDRNDALPKTICIDCYQKIKRWSIFARKCKKTQKDLKSQQSKCDSLPESVALAVPEAVATPTLKKIEILAIKQEEEVLPLSEESQATLVKKQEKEVVDVKPADVLEPTHATESKPKPMKTKDKAAEPVVYSCKYCVKTYTNRHTYLRHVSIMHENPQKFHCAHCPKTFTAKPVLKCHLETHAPNRDFCCHVCGATFRTNSALRCHLQLHRPDYTGFECTECGKCFKLPHQLERHRKTHSNLRPHQCSECNLSFSMRHNLNRHIDAIHNPVVKRACPTCGKEYRYLNHYQAHLLRHAGKRDNKCTVCDKGFVTRNDLMRHARIHTREKPFKCTICSMTFADCSNRKRHILSHEGKAKPKSRSKANVKKTLASEETKTYTSLETYYQVDDFDNVEYDNVDDVLMTTTACYEATGQELKAKEGYGIYMKGVADLGTEEGMFLTEGEFGEMEMPVFLEVGDDGTEVLMKDEGEMFLADGEATDGFVIGSEILIDGSLLSPP